MSDSCVYCSSVEGLEWHHIWPLSLGGPDELFNMVRVCHTHHGILHEMSGRSNIVELTKAGLARTKEQGIVLGPPLRITPEDLVAMCKDRASGYSLDKLAVKYPYPRQTIYRNIKRHAGALDEYEEEFNQRERQYQLSK